MDEEKKRKSEQEPSGNILKKRRSSSRGADIIVSIKQREIIEEYNQLVKTLKKIIEKNHISDQIVNALADNYNYIRVELPLDDPVVNKIKIDCDQLLALISVLKKGDLFRKSGLSKTGSSTSFSSSSSNSLHVSFKSALDSYCRKLIEDTYHDDSQKRENALRRFDDLIKDMPLELSQTEQRSIISKIQEIMSWISVIKRETKEKNHVEGETNPLLLNLNRLAWLLQTQSASCAAIALTDKKILIAENNIFRGSKSNGKTILYIKTVLNYFIQLAKGDIDLLSEDWFHILKTIYDAKFDGQGKGEIGAIRGSKNKIFHTLIKFIASRDFNINDNKKEMETKLYHALGNTIIEVSHSKEHIGTIVGLCLKIIWKFVSIDRFIRASRDDESLFEYLRDTDLLKNIKFDDFESLNDFKLLKTILENCDQFDLDEEEKKEEKYQKQEKEECEKQEESEGSEENKEKTYKSCNVIKTYREKLQNKMDLDKILEEDFEWLANESYGCAILAVDEKNIHAELKIIEIMLILALKETKTNNPNPAGSKPNRLRSIPEIEEFTLLSKRFFDFVKKIPEYEKSKKLNLLVVRLEDFIRNLESKKEKGIRIDAYIGISKKCCRKCFYAIESVREVMTGLTNLPRVSGSHYQTFEGNPPNFLGSKRNHRGSAKAGMANVILQNIRNAFWIKMSGVHASPLKTMSPDSPHFIPSSGSSTPLGVNNEPFSFDEGQAYLFDFMEKGWSDIDKTLLEPSEMLQKGWNCFDVAINVEISKHPEVRSFDRSDFIPYALNQMNSPECRSLLAPEIRHAAALAALAANFEEGSLEAQREIMDLFKLAEELPDDAATKRALEQEGNDILDKNNKKNQELVAFALPRSMWTEELRQLFTDYIEAHENMHGPWASCNDQIGRTEGSRLSIKELDEFFSHKDNRDKHKEAYSAYKEMRDEIFVPYEQAFLDYCSSEATCRTYIEQYYGQQGWFAFQNNTAERSTSMIDIVSRYIQMDILIYHQVSGELLYSTRKDDCSGFPKQLAITFNGHNHFTAGDPRIDQSMQIMENTTSLHVTDSITNSDNSEIRVLAASMSAILSSNVVYDSMALQLIVGYSSDASDMSEVGGNQNSDELAPSSH